MDGKVEIVPFGMQHFDAVLRLWRKSEGIALGASDSRSSIRAYLARNGGMSSVAMSGGKVAGVVLAGHDGRRGFLHHLAVDPRFRRQGVGRGLVDRSLCQLRDAGMEKCHLFVINRNAGGIAFWKSVGWTSRTDITIMSKDIPRGSRRGRMPGKARKAKHDDDSGAC